MLTSPDDQVPAFTDASGTVWTARRSTVELAHLVVDAYAAMAAQYAPGVEHVFVDPPEFTITLNPPLSDDAAPSPSR